MHGPAQHASSNNKGNSKGNRRGDNDRGAAKRSLGSTPSPDTRRLVRAFRAYSGPVPQLNGCHPYSAPPRPAAQYELFCTLSRCSLLSWRQSGGRLTAPTNLSSVRAAASGASAGACTQTSQSSILSSSGSSSVSRHAWMDRDSADRLGRLRSAAAALAAALGLHSITSSLADTG